MKILYAYLLVFIVSLFSSVSSNAQIPFNWIVDEVNPGEDVALFPEESIFTEGARSCHLKLKSNRVPYLYSEVFYVSPGTDYSFSINVYDQDTAGQVKIYMDFKDTYGFDIFGATPVFSRDSLDWQTISWSGTVPAQAVVGYILIKFYCQPSLYTFNGEANIWIDNVMFIQSGQNLALNGGFEQWLVDVQELNRTDNDLVIFPNPAMDKSNIILKTLVNRLVIADVAGRIIQVFDGPVQSLYSFDVSGFPVGIYLISAQDPDGNLYRGKLIVSR